MSLIYWYFWHNEWNDCFLNLATKWINESTLEKFVRRTLTNKIAFLPSKIAMVYCPRFTLTTSELPLMAIGKWLLGKFFGIKLEWILLLLFIRIGFLMKLDNNKKKLWSWTRIWIIQEICYKLDKSGLNLLWWTKTALKIGFLTFEEWKHQWKLAFYLWKNEQTFENWPNNFWWTNTPFGSSVAFKSGFRIEFHGSKRKSQEIETIFE